MEDEPSRETNEGTARTTAVRARHSDVVERCDYEAVQAVCQNRLHTVGDFGEDRGIWRRRKGIGGAEERIRLMDGDCMRPAPSCRPTYARTEGGRVEWSENIVWKS